VAPPMLCSARTLRHRRAPPRQKNLSLRQPPPNFFTAQPNLSRICKNSQPAEYFFSAQFQRTQK